MDNPHVTVTSVKTEVNKMNGAYFRSVQTTFTP